MYQLKYSETDHKIRFISSASSYMFRHHDSIVREIINNKGTSVQNLIQALFALTNPRIMCCTHEPFLLINSLMMAPWCRNM
jgi:hypothetical protein